MPESLAEEVLEELAPPLTGRRVLLKPNCLMAVPWERGVTTHPSLVRAMVAALERRGARVEVGDNPGARGYGSSTHCFRASGLLDAAGRHFVELGRDTAKIRIDSRFMDQVVVSRRVLEADYVVSLPKLKTHCLTLLTGALKNMYGILAGGEKARLHYLAKTGNNFSELLVDVFAVRPPDLTVMDAVVAMEGDGPSHGGLRRVGKVVASRNAVAADTVAARLMGIPTARIGYLELAAARGLGPLDRRGTTVDGDVSPVPGFRLPSTFRLGLMTALSNRLVFNVLHRSRLRVNPHECVGCGECLAACPSGAMRRAGETFVIRPDSCHQCFCCYEMCPSGAIEVRGALGALLKKGGEG